MANKNNGFCKKKIDIFYLIGHFSQTVWNSTKEVGVGTAESKSKNFFLVARYSPKGNVGGKYNDNVSPPLPGEFNFFLLLGKVPRKIM